MKLQTSNDPFMDTTNRVGPMDILKVEKEQVPSNSNKQGDNGVRNLENKKKDQQCSKSTIILSAVTIVLLITTVVVLCVIFLASDDDSSILNCNVPFTLNQFALWLVGNSATDIQDTVWNTMYSWELKKPNIPKSPILMDIDMYMWDNEISMTNTKFTAITSLTDDEEEDEIVVPAVTELRKLETKSVQSDPVPNLKADFSMEDCQEALNLAKQKPNYKLNDVKIRDWSAGGLGFSMYMLNDNMKMIDNEFIMGGTTNSEALMELDSNNFATGAVKRTNNKIKDTKNHMYMFNNELSMTNTVFTMNVGSSSSVSVDENLQMQAFDIDTMNINMYMCHNSMSMDTTVFTMNIGSNSIPSPENTNSLEDNIKNGDSNTLDMSQILPIIALGLQEQQSNLGVSQNDPTDVFTWMENLAAASTTNTLDINMHMYNNKMSMKTTTFTFNVGNVQNVNQNSDQIIKKDTQRRQLNDDTDLYLKNSQMSMVDTIFTMNVGMPNQVQDENLSQAGGRQISIKNLNVKMYMYTNKMTMKDTFFTSNMN